jgi:hypothetical protein
MNTALSMFDGLFIIPVLQVFWTFFSILSGGIYFEEVRMGANESGTTAATLLARRKAPRTIHLLISFTATAPTNATTLPLLRLTSLVVSLPYLYRSSQFDSFTPGQMLGFSFGVVVVFVGVYMLAPSPKDHKDIETAAKEMDERETVKLRSPQSNGASPGQQLQANRARGFSWEEDAGKTKTRMVR